MAKIYDDAKDKNVATELLYTDGTDFFYDEDMENEVDFSVDGKELFVKGVVAVDEDGVMAKAVSCAANGVITFGFPTA